MEQFLTLLGGIEQRGNGNNNNNNNNGNNNNDENDNNDGNDNNSNDDDENNMVNNEIDEDDDDDDDYSGDDDEIDYGEDDEEEDEEGIEFHALLLRMLQRLQSDRLCSSHEQLLERLLTYEKDLKPQSKEYEAFKLIPRDKFVPEKYKERAFNDAPLDITELDTNLSSPHIYPKCLLLMDIKEGQRILDIGCGTGHLSVLAAHIGGPTCTVDGWDLSPQIINCANSFLGQFNGKYKNVKYKVHNAFWPRVSQANKKWDRIHVGASIPVELKEQLYQLLSPGGKLVAPIADGLFVVTNDPQKGFIEYKTLEVRYRMLKYPNTIPLWKPSNHHQYPNEIRSQIETLFKIYLFRSSILTYLPLELLFNIIQWIYFNLADDTPDSVSLLDKEQLRKIKESQFRRRQALQQAAMDLSESIQGDSDLQGDNSDQLEGNSDCDDQEEDDDDSSFDDNDFNFTFKTNGDKSIPNDNKNTGVDTDNNNESVSGKNNQPMSTTQDGLSEQDSVDNIDC